MAARPAPSPDALTGLLEAAKSLNASLDLHRVLVRICEESAAILAADLAVVCLSDDGDGLRVEAGYGLDAEASGRRIESGRGVAGLAAQRDEPTLSSDGLAVPMHWDGDLRGVLAVRWTRPRTPTPDELDLLTAFGELAAAACRNASAHAELSRVARTDSLTGCLNRAAFHDGLVRELERCRRTGRSLSLAVVDLDAFKEVNERRGHQAGDQVLRRVGSALRESVRPYDLVGRYGGDEFAIVAVDTDEPEAREVADRAIARAGTEATAGVAEWRHGESSAELIRRADLALLHAKHCGSRGRAVRASQLALSESR